MDLKTIDLEKSEVVLGKKYLLKERLGSGSFGQIFLVVNKENNIQAAAKLEKRGAHSTLVREAKTISDLRGQTGFPSLYDYGKEDDYNYIVLSLLGLNMEKLFKLCNQKFSLKTVLMIADQMISRIETLHSKNYIHRDIKPENFCIGRNSSGKHIFLIDYGLAKNYKDPTGKHISFKENKSLVGTARYASLNAHLGYEQSRRDDLEAIGYTLVYFLLGKLPWQNMRVDEKNQKYQKIAELKCKIPVEQLCSGLPSQFATYLNYVKNLEFMEEPDYKYLKKLFRTLFVENGYDFDYEYDWVDILKSQTSTEPSRPMLKLTEYLPQNEEKKGPAGQKITPITLDRDMGYKHREQNHNNAKPVQKGLDGGQGEGGNSPMFNPVRSFNVNLGPKGMMFGNFRREESPKKKKTIIQGSLVKNMSSNSLYSKTMNLSGGLCVEEEIPVEGRMDNSPVEARAGATRRFTIKKEGIVSGESGTLTVFEDSRDPKTFQRTKTKTYTYSDARNIKRSPFAHFSLVDPRSYTARKVDPHKHERNSNEEGKS